MIFNKDKDSIILRSFMQYVFIFIFLASCQSTNKREMNSKTNTNIYNQKVNAPDGTTIDFKDLKDKVILVVNTATQCGLTPQFNGLEQLYQTYENDGLVVIGFPCNQFMGQEPLTNETMIETCKINHGVTFPLTEKIEVNGKNTHPVYKYLKEELGGFLGSKIKWNFTKFLIDKNGIPVKRYAPTTKPIEMENDIRKLLGLE